MTWLVGREQEAIRRWGGDRCIAERSQWSVPGSRVGSIGNVRAQSLPNYGTSTPDSDRSSEVDLDPERCNMKLVRIPGFRYLNVQPCSGTFRGRVPWR